MNTENARQSTINARAHLFERSVHFQSSMAYSRNFARVLMPGRYVGAEAAEDNDEPFDEKMKRHEQVRRNTERFPEDFMFQLDKQEFAALMSQTAISNPGRGGRRKLPYAFTEHGAIMAASVLNSPRAVEVSVQVVRAFVRLRELLASNKELAKKLDALELKLSSHDKTIVQIVNAIRDLISPSEPKEKHPIGFAPWDEKK